MRVSRRISGFYKPVLLVLSICAIIYLVQDSKSDDDDDTDHNAKAQKAKKSKSHHGGHSKNHEPEDYEVGGQDYFDGFDGTIIGRGVDKAVPMPVYRDRGDLGNYEPDPDKIRSQETGPGDYGKIAVNWDKATEDDQVKKAIKEFGFNLVTSDKISMTRIPGDLRDKKCKFVDYPEKLPKVSIIIVFHNEGWSPLMRTVHSVIAQSPPELLGEVVMVDDFSAKPHLAQPLDDYVKQFDGKVKIVRNKRREGLIRARSIGAQNAIFEVLVFLDAHCEAEFNWLPPLLAPIARNDRISTVPMIDGIDGNHYTFTSQGGGDAYGRATGAWDWSFLWKRIHLPAEEDKKLPSKMQPFPSPAMAGGLFAINREYFKNILYYDPGLEVWGGENFELSYKLWMCGGGMLFVPCSRVGHIYRLEGWDGNPPPAYVPPNPSMRNYRRVIETWWDDYKKYFYVSRPESKTLDFADISEQVAFRKDHCPHSFEWFMKEIAYGVVREYPLPPMNKYWGEIHVSTGNQCLDSMGHTNGGAIETYYCHKQGGNQMFRLNMASQLMQYDQCLFKDYSGILKLAHCAQGDKTGWEFDAATGLLTYGEKKKGVSCIELDNNINGQSKVIFATCDENKPEQKFKINKIEST